MRPVAPALPARLAVPVWLERLAPGMDRAVQVALGEDGAIRLQTLRQPDGLTVQIQFTDPELQAIAGIHADRLRSTLETHFAEPVRLALPDGLAADTGTTDSGTNQQDSASAHQRDPGPATETHRPRTADPDLPTQTPTHSPLTGRREWVG